MIKKPIKQVYEQGRRGSFGDQSAKRLGGFVMTRERLRFFRTIAVLILAGVITGCAVEAGSSRRPAPQQTPRSSASRPLDAKQTERVQRVMMPLLRAANKPRRSNDVRVRVIDDPTINAANAGGGEFQITTGLLAKANDDHLRGVLAHEIAHDDLGHVARAQTLGVGLNIGVILLEQLIPGSSAVTPIAGALIANSYSRSEELEADRHGVEILRRAGYSKEVMIDTLTWLMRTPGGDSGGGFLSTHPGIEERIDALRKLP